MPPGNRLLARPLPPRPAGAVRQPVRRPVDDASPCEGAVLACIDDRVTHDGARLLRDFQLAPRAFANLIQCETANATGHGRRLDIADRCHDQDQLAIAELGWVTEGDMYSSRSRSPSCQPPVSDGCTGDP